MWATGPPCHSPPILHALSWNSDAVRSPWPHGARCAESYIVAFPYIPQNGRYARQSALTDRCNVAHSTHGLAAHGDGRCAEFHPGLLTLRCTKSGAAQLGDPGVPGNIGRDAITPAPNGPMEAYWEKRDLQPDSRPHCALPPAPNQGSLFARTGGVVSGIGGIYPAPFAVAPSQCRGVFLARTPCGSPPE